MNASLLQSDSFAGQVRSLLAAVDRLQAEIGELRCDNAGLQQQVSELRCEAGYWKSRHADAVQRNIRLQVELEQAKAEIRHLKAERFGKQSEKQSATDRSNQLDEHLGRAYHLLSDCFHADETRWRVSVERSGKIGYRWWLYRLNRERLRHAIGTGEFATADATLRQHVAAMAAQREAELADDKLRDPCRKVLVSLHEHWGGLTLFVDDPRIPLDNNYGERLIRNPAVGRKN